MHGPFLIILSRIPEQASFQNIQDSIQVWIPEHIISEKSGFQNTSFQNKKHKKLINFKYTATFTRSFPNLIYSLLTTGTYGFN